MQLIGSNFYKNTFRIQKSCSSNGYGNDARIVNRLRLRKNKPLPNDVTDTGFVTLTVTDNIRFPRKSLKKRKNSGNVTILMVIAIPFLVAMLALVIDLGRIALARARLQVAADRAAFAGASVLAHAQNSFARENWDIFRAYRDLEKEYINGGQQNTDAGKQLFDKYMAKRNMADEKIGNIRSTMNDHAREVSLDLLSLNAPYSTGETLIDSEPILSDNEDKEAQWGHLTFGYIQGPNFIDPDSYDSQGRKAFRYYIKSPESDKSRIAVIARQNISPMLTGRIGGEKVEIEATAIAQSYGGSIEEFAKKPTDTVEDAEKQISDEERDELYRAALIE